MKWPTTITFIRHGESIFNITKDRKKADPEYRAFATQFDTEYATADSPEWPSAALQAQAHRMWKKFRCAVNDYDTPLTDAGVMQARTTGRELQKTVGVPEVIYVSPYLRTRQTLELITESWPALATVKTVQDERIREQEYGLRNIYNDWRVYYAFHPIQGLYAKMEGDYAYRHLNGENKADVRDRGRSFLTTLIREHAEQNVLMVSHHITLLSFRGLLERWGREQFEEVDKNEKPANCGVTIYRGHPEEGRSGRLVLDMYNKILYKP
jgi:broad specificity phosphatase PhoE